VVVRVDADTVAGEEEGVCVVEDRPAIAVETAERVMERPPA
jgi:hypothetical protein